MTVAARTNACKGWGALPSGALVGLRSYLFLPPSKLVTIWNYKLEKHIFVCI